MEFRSLGVFGGSLGVWEFRHIFRIHRVETPCMVFPKFSPEATAARRANLLSAQGNALGFNSERIIPPWKGISNWYSYFYALGTYLVIGIIHSPTKIVWWNSMARGLRRSILIIRLLPFQGEMLARKLKPRALPWAESLLPLSGRRCIRQSSNWGLLSRGTVAFDRAQTGGSFRVALLHSTELILGGSFAGRRCIRQSSNWGLLSQLIGCEKPLFTMGVNGGSNFHEPFV